MADAREIARGADNRIAIGFEFVANDLVFKDQPSDPVQETDELSVTLDQMLEDLKPGVFFLLNGRLIPERTATIPPYNNDYLIRYNVGQVVEGNIRIVGETDLEEEDLPDELLAAVDEDLSPEDLTLEPHNAAFVRAYSVRPEEEDLLNREHELD